MDCLKLDFTQTIACILLRDQIILAIAVEEDRAEDDEAFTSTLEASGLAKGRMEYLL